MEGSQCDDTGSSVDDYDLSQRRRWDTTCEVEARQSGGGRSFWARQRVRVALFGDVTWPEMDRKAQLQELLLIAKVRHDVQMPALAKMSSPAS